GTGTRRLELTDLLQRYRLAGRVERRGGRVQPGRTADDLRDEDRRVVAGQQQRLGVVRAVTGRIREPVQGDLSRAACRDLPQPDVLPAGVDRVVPGVGDPDRPVGLHRQVFRVAGAARVRHRRLALALAVEEEDPDGLAVGVAVVLDDVPVIGGGEAGEVDE